MPQPTSQPILQHPKFAKHQFDPHRPVNWRADLVERHVTERTVRRIGSDPWMARYAAFYRRWRSAGTLTERERLFAQYPDVYYAKGWADTADEFTAQLQALLLTKLPADEIALRENLYLPALEAYEALFYDVRSRITNTSYIVRAALQSARDTPTLRDAPLLTDERRWACYRIFAYFGGPVALDYAISGFERRDETTVERVREWYDSTFRSLMRRNSAMLTHAMEPRPANVMRLIELNLKSLELQQTERLAQGGTEGPMRELCEMAGRLLEAVHWRIGPPDASGVDNTTAAERELRASPYGLTAVEADRLAAGESLTELLEEARAHTLPMSRQTERVAAAAKEE